MARFSIIIPDALSEAVRARAEEDGVSLAEVGRRALGAWCGVSDAPPYTTPETHAETSTTPPGEPFDTGADLRHDLAAALARADQAEGIALARLEEIARLRQDLDAERDRTHGAMIESVSIGVRALTTAETTRPNRRTAREWFRDVFKV